MRTTAARRTATMNRSCFRIIECVLVWLAGRRVDAIVLRPNTRRTPVPGADHRRSPPCRAVSWKPRDSGVQAGRLRSLRAADEVLDARRSVAAALSIGGFQGCGWLAPGGRAGGRERQGSERDRQTGGQHSRARAPPPPRAVFRHGSSSAVARRPQSRDRPIRDGEVCAKTFRKFKRPRPRPAQMSRSCPTIASVHGSSAARRSSAASGLHRNARDRRAQSN